MSTITLTCLTAEAARFEALGFTCITDGGHVRAVRAADATVDQEECVLAGGNAMYFGVIRRQECQSSLFVCMNGRIMWADCSQSDDTPVCRVLEDGSVVGLEFALRYWDLVAEVKLAFRQAAASNRPGKSARVLAEALTAKAVTAAQKFRSQAKSAVQKVVNKRAR